MEAWQVLTGIGVGLCLGLVLAAVVRLPAPGVSRPLIGFVVCAALWALGDSTAALAGDLAQKQIGVAMLYTGVIYLPAFWWIATLRWTQDRGHRLHMTGRWWAWAPLLWATAMWAVMITNPWHGLFLTPIVGGRNLYQPLWWCMAIPNYLLIVGMLGVEVDFVRRVSLPAVRRQAAFLIAASLVTLTGSAAWVAGVQFNGTLLILSTSSVLLFVGMVREGVFGVLPVALRVLAENDPDGLVVVRPEGQVAYLNARARDLLGPIGVRIETQLPRGLRDVARNPDGSPLASHAPDWERAWWESLVRPEGALCRLGSEDALWIHMSARSLRGPRGGLRAICLRLRDITAEKHAEVQLRRTRRMESVAELSRGVAHDFQNLLAVVRGNAELLTADLPDDPSLQRKAFRILDAGRRARELADQLQLYAGGTDPVRKRLELSETLREISEFLLPDLEKTVRCELQLASEPLPVEADATQLRQILFNLLVNAREALPDAGGVITASTGSCWLDPAKVENLVAGRAEPAAEYAYARIADTGVGMDATTQERLFEPFFSTKGKRRGVGLSSALGIVRAHGALLQLETQQDRGSTFGLYLPLERD